MILGVKVHISMMAEQIQLKFKMIFVLLQGILKWWSSVIKLQMHEKHFLVPVMYLAVWHTIVCLDYHDKWSIYYASLLTVFNLLHSSMLFKKHLSKLDFNVASAWEVPFGIFTTFWKHFWMIWKLVLPNTAPSSSEAVMLFCVPHLLSYGSTV